MNTLFDYIVIIGTVLVAAGLLYFIIRSLKRPEQPPAEL